ncbi:MAG: DsbA family protein [Thermomicrobiales bacterium]
MTKPVSIDVYYDYGCPYVYAAAVWLRDLQCKLGDKLIVNWKYFPLEQVNSGEGPEWKLWDQPADFVSRGRTAFHGAIAAKRQGPEAFNAFHFALLDAKHLDNKNGTPQKVVVDVARAAGLDMKRFEDWMTYRCFRKSGEIRASRSSSVFWYTDTRLSRQFRRLSQNASGTEPEKTLEVWEKVRRLIQGRRLRKSNGPSNQRTISSPQMSSTDRAGRCDPGREYSMV